MPATNCFCGGGLRGRCRECTRDDCPRKRLGAGSWHKALPRLQRLSTRELRRSYPHLNLRDLEDHVRRNGKRHEERKADRAAASTNPPRRGRSRTPVKRAYVRCHLREANHSSKPRRDALHAAGDRSNGNRGTWRNPRQPHTLPRVSSSSSTRGTLVAEDSEKSDNDKSSESSASTKASQITFTVVV